MSGKKLHFGIIGAGRIGKVHAETLAFRLPEAEIVCIADVDRAAAEALAARCGIPKVVATAEEVIGDPKVEAVLICTPTGTHADLIVQAAKAGKQIFCEKPIAFSLDKIDMALEAVKKAGRKAADRIQSAIRLELQARARSRGERRDRAAGLMHIVSRDPAPPSIAYIRTSGGLFLDMMIHDFDMARFLIGDEVEEIYTTGGVLAEPEIGEAGDLDMAVVVLRFKKGTIGTIDNSRKAVFGYDQRVEILGTKGKIATENRFPNEVVVSTGESVYSDLPLKFFMDRYPESFALEVAEFVQAVIDDKPTPVTGADGRVPVVMALAAKKSFDEHRPVKLAEVSA